MLEQRGFSRKTPKLTEQSHADGFMSVMWKVQQLLTRTVQHCESLLGFHNSGVLEMV